MRQIFLLATVMALGACARKSGSPTVEGGGAAAGDRNGCDQEISLACSDGFVDGCLEKGKGGGTLTLSHVCVKEGSRSGPGCDKEVAQTCPEGQIDACVASPPAASTHVCVVPVAAP